MHFNVLEADGHERERLWIRGGFPDSFLSQSDMASAAWRENFIRTYLERDIPQLGPRVPAETLRRFWTMLAHLQGSTLNAAQLARGLGVDGTTVARYLDLLVDLLLVRRLPSFHANVGKRPVKSPKVYSVTAASCIFELVYCARHAKLEGSSHQEVILHSRCDCLTAVNALPYR